MSSASARIKPFHLFAHRDGNYVIRVEAMTAARLDGETATILEDVQRQPNSPLGPHQVEALARLGLLGDTHDSPRKGKAPRADPVSYIVLLVTQSCNLRCVYCYGDGGGYGSGGNLSPQTARKAVDWLIEQSGAVKNLSIQFFGGEPLARFSLLRDIVAYARKRAEEAGKTMRFTMVTNGSLLDDEKIGFVKEHAIQTVISFDGPRAIQDAQRPLASGKGSYEAIVPNLRRMLLVMPETICQAMVLGDTDPREVKRALQEIGFKRIAFAIASPSLFDHKGAGAPAARPIGGLLGLMEEESEQWLAYTKNRDLEGLELFRRRGGILSDAVAQLVHGERMYFHCGAGRKLVGVATSGDVFLCHRFVGQDTYKLGTVFEKELRREAYQQSPVEYAEPCMNCFARYHCGGGCMHDNAGIGGSVFSPSEDMCRIYQRRVELAAWVTCQFDESDRAFLVDQDIIPPKFCPLDFP
jgi:uncharacterized protein